MGQICVDTRGRENVSCVETSCWLPGEPSNEKEVPEGSERDGKGK